MLVASTPVASGDYTNNVAAGTATATVMYAGDDNHAASNGSNNFTIDPAPVTAQAGSYSGLYDGSAHAVSPCMVSGGFGLTCTNMPNMVGPDVGSGAVTATVDQPIGNFTVTYLAGSYSITPAVTTTTVSCSPNSFVYTGSPIEPCTASVTGPGGLNDPLTVSYVGDTTNVGSVTANASYAGGGNYQASNGSDNYTITAADQTAYITNSPQIYTGSPLTATVACSGGGAATLVSGGTGTVAGPYQAYVDCAATVNYAAGTNLDAGFFVIIDTTPITLGDTSWRYYDEVDNIDLPGHDYVAGPGTPPSGAGSARLFTNIDVPGPPQDPGSRKSLYTSQFATVRLDTITSLRYSTFMDAAGAGAGAAALQFNVDFDTTDMGAGSNNWQGRVNYTPGTVNGAVMTGTWQEWDAFNGYFWYSQPGLVPAGLTGMPCTFEAPCTIAQMLADHPNMGVHASLDPMGGANLGYGFLGFYAQPDSKTYVDDFVISVDDGIVNPGPNAPTINDFAFDFEPGMVTATIVADNKIV